MWPVTGRLMSRMAAGGPPPLVSLPPPHRARPSRTQRWWGSSSSSASPPWTTSPSATLPATWGRARRSAHPPTACASSTAWMRAGAGPNPSRAEDGPRKNDIILCFLPFIFVSFLAAKKMRKVVENRRWRKLGFGGFRRWFSMLQHTNFSNVWLFFFLAVVHFRLPFLAEGEFFNGQF